MISLLKPSHSSTEQAYQHVPSNEHSPPRLSLMNRQSLNLHSTRMQSANDVPRNVQRSKLDRTIRQTLKSPQYQSMSANEQSIKVAVMWPPSMCGALILQ